MAEASSIGEGAAARLREAGLASVATTRYGEPAIELLARVRELRPTLVAVGSRGQSDVQPMLLGSVSAQVARYTTAPVLVARQAGALNEGLPQRIVLVVDPETRARAAVAWLGRHGWLDRSRVILLGLLGSTGSGMSADLSPGGAIMPAGAVPASASSAAAAGQPRVIDEPGLAREPGRVNATPR